VLSMARRTGCSATLRAALGFREGDGLAGAFQLLGSMTAGRCRSCRWAGGVLCGLGAHWLPGLAVGQDDPLNALVAG